MKLEILSLLSLVGVALAQRRRGAEIDAGDESTAARGARGQQPELDLPAGQFTRRTMKSYKNNKCPVVADYPMSGSLGQGTTNFREYPHYMVGLLNYPVSFVPSILSNHVSGRKIGGAGGAPFTEVPNSGYSGINDYLFWKKEVTSYVDPKTGKTFSKVNNNTDNEVGQYHLISDKGYGTYQQSEDFALHMIHVRIEKPFTYRHGESTFETWTEVENLKTVLLHDPYELIQWENHGDIQVTYNIPNDEGQTWLDWKYDRVLTGRDFDPEDLVLINPDCGLFLDEHMPSIVAFDPKSGIIKSHFVRFPDLERTEAEDGTVGYEFKDEVWLSTRGDKVHCDLDDLKLNTCNVTEKRIDKNPFFARVINQQAVVGLVQIGDGSLVAVFQRNLFGEPGPRVYRIDPGDCTKDCPPRIVEFLGFYRWEAGGADRLYGASGVDGSSRRLAVIEGEKSYPNGHTWPYDKYPRQQLCVFDLQVKDPSSWVFTRKRCVLNLQHISDPFDTDNNGVFKAGFSGATDMVLVHNDICVLIGTDNNYPQGSNPFKLNPADVPFWTETVDTRFIIVCFVDAIFHQNYPLFDP